MSRRLLTGGIVWAGTACTPRAAWVLVDGDRIAAVGDEGGPGAASLPAADQSIDITGSHVLPGFVDVHLHLSQAAWFPLGTDGLGWQSLADALRAVRVRADVDSVAPWVLFWRVAQWGWPQGRLPTAAELDRAAPGRRVLVSTLNMHRGALSSAGLAAIGLDSAGAARFGGDVTRDRSPTHPHRRRSSLALTAQHARSTGECRMMAITQLAADTDGRAFCRRKRAARKKPQGSPALPHTSALRRRLPPARPRRSRYISDETARTPGATLLSGTAG